MLQKFSRRGMFYRRYNRYVSQSRFSTDSSGYELLLRSEKDFDENTKKLGKPIFVKMDNGDSKLWGDKSGQGDWQETELKNFDSPKKWENEERVFVSHSEKDILNTLNKGHIHLSYAQKMSKLNEADRAYKEKTDEILSKGASDFSANLSESIRSVTERVRILGEKFHLSISEQKEIAEKSFNEELQKQKSDVNKRLDEVTYQAKNDIKNLKDKQNEIEKDAEDKFKSLEAKAKEEFKSLQDKYEFLEWKWKKKFIYLVIVLVLLLLIDKNSEKLENKVVKLMLDYFGIEIFRKDQNREKIKDITSYLNEEIQRLQIKYNSSFFGYKFFSYFGSHGYSHNLRMQALLNLKEEILKLTPSDLSEIEKHISTHTKELLHEAYNFDKKLEKEDENFLDIFLNKKFQLSIKRDGLMKLDETVNTSESDSHKTSDLTTVHASPISQNANNDVPFDRNKATKNHNGEENVSASLVGFVLR